MRGFRGQKNLLLNFSLFYNDFSFFNVLALIFVIKLLSGSGYIPCFICSIFWLHFRALRSFLVRLSIDVFDFYSVRLTLARVTEAATRGVLCKKVFLEISQNSEENICARVSFLIKLQACKNTFFTEHLWTAAFSVISVSSVSITITECLVLLWYLRSTFFYV